MHCEIYKSIKKTNYYLFIKKCDDFSQVPDALLEMLGRLEWVMALELMPDRVLAQADPEKVIEQLNIQGFYLQIPPGKDHADHKYSL